MCQNSEEQFVFNGSSALLKFKPFSKVGFQSNASEVSKVSPYVHFANNVAQAICAKVGQSNDWRVPTFETIKLSPHITNLFSLLLPLINTINPPHVFWHFSLYVMIFFADFLQSCSPSSTSVMLNDKCISHPLLPEATNLSLTAPLTLPDASEATHLWWKIKHQWDLLPLLPVFKPEPFKHTLVQCGFKNEYLPTRLKAGAYDGKALQWQRQCRASGKIYCSHSSEGFINSSRGFWPDSAICGSVSVSGASGHSFNTACDFMFTVPLM